MEVSGLASHSLHCTFWERGVHWLVDRSLGGAISWKATILGKYTVIIGGGWNWLKIVFTDGLWYKHWVLLLHSWIVTEVGWSNNTHLKRSCMLRPNVSKLTMSSSAPCCLTCPNTDMPMIAYMNVIRAKSAPMLKRAGSDTTNANSSFLMPLAACSMQHRGEGQHT